MKSGHRVSIPNFIYFKTPYGLFLMNNYTLYPINPVFSIPEGEIIQ